MKQSMPPRKKGDRLAVGIAFGKRVRELRETKGWTLEVLAETAKMNELQVGHIERGASDPKLSTMVKLAKALGITISELLRGFK
jgi:transcriptional regulator with XRE-family HTH domain